MTDLAVASRGQGTDAILERRRVEYEKTGRITPESRRVQMPADRSAPPSARIETRSAPTETRSQRTARIDTAARALAASEPAPAPYFGDAHTGTGLRTVRDRATGQEGVLLAASLAAYDAQRRSKVQYGENRVDFNVDQYLTRNIESRDMGVVSGAAGGFTVPQGGFLDSILFGLKYYSAILGRARVWHSTNPVNGKPFGGPATYPVLFSDTANVTAALGENTLISEGDFTLGKVTFGQCPAYVASNLIRFGRGLVQDSQVDVPSMVAEAYAQRIGRELDAVFTATMLANVNIPTVTTVGAAAITLADITNLIYTLDLAARGSDSTAFVMAKATAKYLRTSLVDSQGRPLMVDATFTVTQESTSQLGGTMTRNVRVPSLFGIPVLESSAMPAMTAGLQSVIVASFEQAFVFRFVEASVQRLEERYADTGEVGFVGWMRADGQVADYNAAAILVQHA